MTGTGDGGCAFGTAVMLKQLQAMLVEVNGVRLGKDIEHIHRMRVASRRLRAALPLFAPCFSAKKVAAWGAPLRKVTRSLGAARDMDVQMECLNRFLAGVKLSQHIPGVRRIHLRWAQQRQKLQTRVLAVLDEMQRSRIFEKMGSALLPYTLGVDPNQPPPGGLYELADRAIGTALDEFLSFEPFITQPEKIAELHQMRIAAKKLRYTLEIFAPIYAEKLASTITVLRSAQDLLGEIHDCDVWAQALPQFLEQEKQKTIAFYGSAGALNLLLPGVRAFQADRAAARIENYQTFVRKWGLWQEKQTWTTLRQVTASPLINLMDLFPSSPAAAHAPGAPETEKPV